MTTCASIQFKDLPVPIQSSSLQLLMQADAGFQQEEQEGLLD